ncbi:hypothetical protein [Humibacillus xanthopallidus]|uniref:hypothetical protein n=1 Tax=Humibacillus xanthopallidus TaxID=412689 RepID=UPI003850FEA7
MSSLRLAAAALALGVAPLSAAPAHASDVGNDTIAGAVVIDSIRPDPWAWSQDTTGTDVTDADDAYLADTCLLSIAVERTVWFTYTDVTGEGFGVDAMASDHSTSTAIFEGDPRAGGAVVACGEDEVAADGEAGQQYWIAAFADRPGSAGGTLDLTVRPLRPPATVSAFTVRPTALVQPDRTVLVTGTYACANAPAYGSSIRGSVGHDGDRAKPRSYFYLPELTCDGDVRVWQATAQTFDAGVPFVGRGTVDTTLWACGDLSCDVGEIRQPITATRLG